jgi:hypothetical protein
LNVLKLIKSAKSEKIWSLLIFLKKLGSKDEMAKREKAYAMHLSINTGDDVDVSKYSKRSKYGVASSTTTSSLTITPRVLSLSNNAQITTSPAPPVRPQERFNGSPRSIFHTTNETTRPAADVSMTMAATNAAHNNDIEQSQRLMRASNDTSSSNADVSNTILENTAASNAARMNAMEEKMRQLETKLKQTQRQPDQTFIYKERSLVDDFGGKNPVKWGLKVASHLWTKEELEQHVLFATEKSKRRPLSVLDGPRPAIQRVEMLMQALPVKFEYCHDKQKFDRNLALMAEQINTKGRNIGYRVRQLFRFNNQLANETTDTNTNNN